MSSWVIALMLGMSIFMGLMGLIAFLWGLKNGQFDDKDKMMQGVLFDSTDDLNKLAETTKPRNKK
ncbi:cbb3-type cytochrome oxidase assembly protein CcoS [Helicobacter sp. 11S02629-2]|uniref:cbb3-type cytochrome oxidase assembly protein CcoS n=1 Tax=Helicobacter sp. 11S02629-2 TaxID=1476195 RepID=UPI000BA7BB75|nr:cbb3-type cytochrome oxidase assembly protein CcoS [Helicobacter sp. 11S02629-2]PAF44352.1 cytochrome oxidase maturation protein, cbb3-type [Helicobacter sp. 11S02629-2]